MKSLLLVLAVAACRHAGDPDPSSLAELFAGTKAPTLDAPVLKAVDWKMPFASAEAALKKHDTEGLQYFAIGDAHAQLERISIDLSKQDHLAELEKLWGKHAREADRGDALTPFGAYVWYGDHVLATLDNNGHRLSLVHYVPLAEELGDPASPLLGFERGRPILGTPHKELAEHYRDVLQREVPLFELALPSDEYEELHVVVQFDPDDVAAKLQFYVPMSNELGEARRALIAKRFGVPTIPLDETVQLPWGGKRVSIVTGGHTVVPWSIEISKP